MLSSDASNDFQVKNISVQGYSYIEYRGNGLPQSNMHPPPTEGDVYLKVSSPFQVFVLQKTGWVEWVSMSRTEECSHPTLKRILFPTNQRFSWVNASGINTFTDTVLSRLGNRPDTAHVHVGIILAQEGQSIAIQSRSLSAPKTATTASRDRSDMDAEPAMQSSSSRISSDGHSRQSSDSRMSVEMTSPSFMERCLNMRTVNRQIRQLILSSPGGYIWNCFQ